MATVFISYCHTDRSTARKLHDAFAETGIACWQDEKCIRVGDDFAVEISKSIRGCDAFVLLLSPASNSSDYVSKEVAIAHHFRKLIVPVVLEHTDVGDALLPYLVRRHYWNLQVRGIHDLAFELRRRLESSVAKQRPSTAGPEFEHRESIAEPLGRKQSPLVTNVEYYAFVRAGGGRRPLGWDLNDTHPPASQGKRPVTGISWSDAVTYCDWVSGRLPTGREGAPLTATDDAPCTGNNLEWRDGGTQRHKHACDVYSSEVVAIMDRDSCSSKIGFRCITVEEPAARQWIQIEGGAITVGTDIAAFTRLATAYNLPMSVRKPLLNRGSSRCNVDSYVIARTCVTNEEYYRFTEATGRPWPSQWDATWLNHHPLPFPRRFISLPVVNVDANHAQAYCIWSRARLPSWIEWQRAAAGPEGCAYPWGVTYDAQLCNSVESERGSLAPVDDYSVGDSQEGVRQMCGNVAEWVLGPDGSFEISGGSYRIPCEISGLAYAFRQVDSRLRSADLGFRVVRG